MLALRQRYQGKVGRGVVDACVHNPPVYVDARHSRFSFWYAFFLVFHVLKIKWYDADFCVLYGGDEWARCHRECVCEFVTPPCMLNAPGTFATSV